MLSLLFALVSVALYAVATARLAWLLRRGHKQRNPAGIALAAGAVLAHGYILHDAIFTGSGLDLGFFNALSLAAWVMALLMVLLTLSQPVENLGIGLFPLAALALLAQIAFAASPSSATLTDPAPGLDFHVLVSIGAHAVLGLAALQAIVLGLQHRLLHQHQPLRAVRALPPLSVMESLLFRMIAIGFALLTIALASGFVYLEDMFAQHLVHKTVLSLAAWALFAVLLGGHFWSGWRGPTAVRFTVGAFVLLLLGYFGSKLVLELILEQA